MSILKRKSNVKTIKENESEVIKNTNKDFINTLNDFDKNDLWYNVLKDCYLGLPDDVDKLVCKNCGALNRNYRFDFCHRDCMYEYNLKHFGKKRPDHSEAILKYWDEGKYELFRNTNNENLNSLEWKMTRLKNHGIIFDSDNTEEVEEKYSQLCRDVQLGPKHWKSTLLKCLVFEEWKEYEEFYLMGFDTLNVDVIDDLSDVELKEWYYRYNSLKSFIAYQNNPKMGRTIAERLYDLKYNERGLTSIYVRSSYEKNWVFYFEENKIRWDYELIRITNNGDKKFIYVPDFYVVINEKKYIIEVKGFVPESWSNIIYRKAECAIQYAKNNDMFYCFSFDSVPPENTNISDYFDSLVLNEKTETEIKNIIRNT